MLTVNQIAKELKKLKTAAIFAHIKPDGDCLGSAYALKNILFRAGISATLVCDSPVPDKFSSFFEKDAFSLVPPQSSYDALIAVDSSDEFRLGSHSEYFIKGKNTFNIDHHISNTRYAHYNFVIERSSTAEIILEIAKALKVTLDKDIAEPLLLGICTDTGNFAHKNVTPQTLFAAGELVSAGADLHNINYLMFKKQPLQRARLFTDVMSRIRYFKDGQIAIAAVTYADLDKNSASADMTEGFTDFPLSVDSVQVALSLLQSGKNQFKVSFRSKGKIDVNEIAQVYGGGGHILASGCIINGELEEVIDKLIYTVSARL